VALSRSRERLCGHGMILNRAGHRHDTFFERILSIGETTG
jgi:hypothetical protein